MDEKNSTTSIFNSNLIEKVSVELPIQKALMGKPLFILLFNFGCPGCVHRAIPFMNSLNSRYSNEINFLGIHTNHEGVDFTNQEIENLATQNKITFPVFRDKNFNDFYYKWRAAGTPHWYIYNANLELKYNMFGSDPDRGLLKLTYIIDEFLNT